MKINLPWRTTVHQGAEPISKEYKPWLILSLVTLLGSLFLLAIAVTAAFIKFGEKSTPIWLVILGVLAILGVGLGFLGFLLIMAVAGLKAWREARRVQVLPPE